MYARALTAALAAAVFSSAAAAQVSLLPGVPYTQNFNTLTGTPDGGTSTTLPANWSFAETGSGANTTYGIGLGNSNNADTYSFGSTGSSDRAFGALGATGGGGLSSTIGVFMRNDTGLLLSRIDVQFRGEQWRRGNGSTPDRLQFEYSLNATSLTTGVWVPFAPLDFTSPVTGNPGNRPLDGNAAGNFTNVAFPISGLGLTPNGTIYFRWVDTNSTAQEDGLAIDDVVITPAPEPGSVLGVAAAVLAAGGWVRRRRAAQRASE